MPFFFKGGRTRIVHYLKWKTPHAFEMSARVQTTYKTSQTQFLFCIDWEITDRCDIGTAMVGLH
jgi:hypothetical protein